MVITRIGLDLAKNVFQVHGVDERGKTVLRKTLRRSDVSRFFANLPPWHCQRKATAPSSTTFPSMGSGIKWQFAWR